MLAGSSCTVRHLQADDLNNYISLFNALPSRGEYFSTLIESPEAMRRQFASTGFVTDKRERFLIDDKFGCLVDVISHFASRTPVSREIAYRLFDTDLQGRGDISEATGMQCDYLFPNYPLNRLELLMNPSNVGSERIAQKSGFTDEGTLRKAFFTNGVLCDAKIYSLLRVEWKMLNGG